MIIYKTTNKVNGKIYIGKACGARTKNRYIGSGKNIMRAIAKYGKENFNRETIDISTTQQELCEKEIFWIRKCDARNPDIGYNILSGGEGGGLSGIDNQFYGKHHSEEVKQKIGAARKGEKNPMYGKTAEKHPRYGLTNSEETRKR